MTEGAPPILSLLLCTRDRAPLLAPCLESAVAALRAAQWPPAELVVVDNGSTDATADLVQHWADGSRWPLRVRLAKEPRPGLAAARNAALRAARGRLLAFTDDDCRLSEGYVRDLLRHDAADGGRLVLRGGRVLLGDCADFACTIKNAATPERYGRGPGEARPLHLGGVVLGCNMAMRREVVARVGSFDERFGAGAPLRAAEDTDYLARAYLAGVVIAYVPDMAVSHFHGRRDPASLRCLLEGYSEGNGGYFAKVLLRDWRLARQFWWDGRDAALEALGLDRRKPEFGFGARDRFAGYVRGAIRFLSLVARRVPPAPRGGPCARRAGVG